MDLVESSLGKVAARTKIQTKSRTFRQTEDSVMVKDHIGDAEDQARRRLGRR